MSHAANHTLVVTGASGRLGRRVVELLLEKPVGQVVAVTRTPDRLKELSGRGAVVRRGDFNDAQSLDAAFAGADRLLLISTDALGPGAGRLKQHLTALDAAVRAGVKHIIYTSMPNPDIDSPIFFAPDHRGSEEALAQSPISWTVHRNNWYTDALIMLGTLPRAVAGGQLFAAAGDGGAAYVTREDCAHAAAASLASANTRSGTLNITGPAVVGYVELSRIVTEITGRTVTYAPVEPEAMKAALISQGIPELLAGLFVGSDVAKAKGKMGPATNDFFELTGRQPTSVAAYLATQRSALIGAGAKAAVQ
jgi:NAD(P)H dehydrogenase (quinone)